MIWVRAALLVQRGMRPTQHGESDATESQGAQARMDNAEEPSLAGPSKTLARSSTCASGEANSALRRNNHCESGFRAFPPLVLCCLQRSASAPAFVPGGFQGDPK